MPRHLEIKYCSQLVLPRTLRFLKIIAWIKFSLSGPKGCFQDAANDVMNSRYWMCRPSSVASIFHLVTHLTWAAALPGPSYYPLMKRDHRSLVQCHRACLVSCIFLCLCLSPSFRIVLACEVHRCFLDSPAPHQSSCPSWKSTLLSVCPSVSSYLSFGWQHFNIHNPNIQNLKVFECHYHILSRKFHTTKLCLPHKIIKSIT